MAVHVEGGGRKKKIPNGLGVVLVPSHVDPWRKEEKKSPGGVRGPEPMMRGLITCDSSTGPRRPPDTTPQVISATAGRQTLRHK